MSNAQIQSLEAYVQLMNNNASTHVVRAGVNLGILAALRTGQKSAEEIANTCGLEPEPTTLLLQALCHTGLVERYDDLYALAQVAHLVAEEFQDFGDHYWQHLESWARTGKNISARDDVPLTDADFLVHAAANDWISTPSAMDAAEILDVGRSRRGLKILEVGGRSSVYGLTALHIDPTTQITILDDQAGVRRAEQTAQSIDASDRVTIIEGDYLTTSLPSRKFDLVILANVIRHHDLAQSSRLLKRLAQALKPVGEMALIDIFPGQEAGDQTRAFFQLELALRRQVGELHSPIELQKVIEESGFKKPRYAQLPASPYLYGMLLAEKK